MKVIKIIGFVVIALVVIIVLLGLIAPRTYEVERSIVIDAPGNKVFYHIQYWNNWKDWSPWIKEDSTMQVTVEGADGAKGSLQRWTGEKAGKGEMINTGVKLNERIDYHLKFIEPWESESDGYIRVEEKDETTEVYWGFYGKSPFPWNIVNLFMSMDKMVGKDFEVGLDLLKSLCEAEMEEVLEYTIEKGTFPSRTYAAIQKEITMNEMQDFFSQTFPKLFESLAKNQIQPAGPPCGIYLKWDEEAGLFQVAVAAPVRKKKKLEGLEIISLPKATTYSIDYYGDYEKSSKAHFAVELYFSKNNLIIKPPVIEEYLTDPTQEPNPAKWLTRIYYFAE